jgi:hypothetical protein
VVADQPQGEVNLDRRDAAGSHGRYVTFQLAEVAILKQLFAGILRLIANLRLPPGASPA